MEEVQTVYEPETEEEIAHYAQVGLQIPGDAGSALIRCRIEFADGQSFVGDVNRRRKFSTLWRA